MSYEIILAEAMAGIDEFIPSQDTGPLVDELLNNSWAVEHELFDAPSVDFSEVRRKAILAIRAALRIAREMEDPVLGDDA